MKCRVPFLFKTGRWSRTISSDTSRSKVWFSAPEYVLGRSLEASTCRSAMTRYISYSVLWRSNDSRTFYPRRPPAIVPLRLADDPNTELKRSQTLFNLSKCIQVIWPLCILYFYLLSKSHFAILIYMTRIHRLLTLD